MPVKVLFISSNPRGAPRLDLDEEHRVLEEANARNGRPFDHRAVLAARIDDLPLMLREHPPEIVHIAGHGQRDGGVAMRAAQTALDPMDTPRDVDIAVLGGADGSAGLLLRAADGSPELLPVHALTALFGLLRHTVRLVVLNACYSDAIAEAILQHAGCVIGSRFAISDAAAIAFARGFYSALGGGDSVRRSFEWGRWESGLRNLDGAGTLMLRHRGDVDPDQRVLVRRGATSGNDLRGQAREISTRPPLPALKAGLHRFDLSAAVDACLPRILKQPHGAIGFAVHCPCDRFVKHLAERIKEGMRHVSHARVREISMVSNLRDMPTVWRRLDEIRAVLQVQDVVCSVVIADAQTPAVLWDRISRDLQELRTKRFVLIIGLREDCALPGVTRIPTPTFLYTHVLDWWQQVLQTRGWNNLLDPVLEASGVSLACSDAELDMDRVYDDLTHAMTVLQDNPDENQFYADWIAPRIGAV